MTEMLKIMSNWRAYCTVAALSLLNSQTYMRGFNFAEEKKLSLKAVKGLMKASPLVNG